MEQPPIMNPPNPYVGTLRIFPGTLVKVSGRPRPNATRFAINFQTGPSLNPRDDLALHLSPCFTPPRVVRNSLRHGSWGLEEAWGNGTLFSPHAGFEIMILAEPDQFKIAINGAHYCEFKHRIPYHEITHLTIDGDVDIERISISSTNYAPSYQPSAPVPQPTSVAPPYPSGPSSAMPMPPMYPTLNPGPQPMPSSNFYPTASNPVGPMPTGNVYASGYPPASVGPQPTGPVPQMYGNQPAGPYPHGAQMGGPTPTGASYQGGYPQVS